MNCNIFISPATKLQGGKLVSPCLSVCRQILCRTITWVVFLRILKFYQLFTGEERRIPLIFDDFHFCRSRVIGFDMTENRIFTLCCMITWVVFLRMFWNIISSLPVKRGGSLSFLVGTISNVLVMEIGWTDVGNGGYILVSILVDSGIIFISCFRVIFRMIDIKYHFLQHFSVMVWSYYVMGLSVVGVYIWLFVWNLFHSFILQILLLGKCFLFLCVIVM
jgi:hypothetical protein